MRSSICIDCCCGLSTQTIHMLALNHPRSCCSFIVLAYQVAWRSQRKDSSLGCSPCHKASWAWECWCCWTSLRIFPKIENSGAEVKVLSLALMLQQVHHLHGCQFFCQCSWSCFIPRRTHDLHGWLVVWLERAGLSYDKTPRSLVSCFEDHSPVAQ